MAKGDDIQYRLTEFGVAVIKLCRKLSKSSSGVQIASQFLRSGTSPAANYAEARGAESKKDFIHKLGITLKELNETSIWLTMAYRASLVSEMEADSILRECSELSRIINQSIKTASKRAIPA